MLITIFILLGIPIILCILHKVLPIGSIGPLIPLSALINVFILPYCIYRSFIDLIKNEKYRFIFAIAVLPIGICLTILGMNIFIGLTAMFGIMDYNLL